MSSAAEARPDFGNQSRHLLVADLQVKRRANEKEGRAHMVRRLRRQAVGPVKRVVQEREDKARMGSRPRSSEVAHLLEQSMAKGRGSPRVGNGDNQKRRHRQVQRQDNCVAITSAAPEENPGAASFVAALL